MIRLYTDINLVKDQLILSNDAFFNQYELSYTDEILHYMRIVDGVTEVRDSTIKTKFGWTTVDKLSTGLKVLLNIVYLGGKSLSPSTSENSVINITECGSNVIEYAFDLADKYTVRIYLGHTQVWRSDNKKDFLINDNYRITTTKELKTILFGGVLNV